MVFPNHQPVFCAFINLIFQCPGPFFWLVNWMTRRSISNKPVSNPELATVNGLISSVISCHFNRTWCPPPSSKLALVILHWIKTIDISIINFHILSHIQICWLKQISEHQLPIHSFPSWWFQPLWTILVNWDDYLWENKKWSKPPTSFCSELIKLMFGQLQSLPSSHRLQLPR